MIPGRLFVPGSRPFDLFDPHRKGRVKLYVKRVFITDDAEILPRYLRFVRGLVDSADLPLNISREMIQESPLLAAIKKNVLGHNAEIPLEIDTTQFAPNTCNIKDGIIYDSITEETDEYILLTTCNGDKEKIFSNGTAAYLPAGGGEFYSIRIESF